MTTGPCESAGCAPDQPGAGRAVPGLRLCQPCLRGLRRRLAELPGHYQRCESALLRRPGQRVERVRGGRPLAMQLDEAVVSARSETIEVLASWAALVVQERRVPAPGDRRAPTLVAFLLAQLDWLAAHPAAGDLAAEVGALTRAMHEVVEPEPGPRPPMGPCPAPGCERPAYAVGEPRAQVRCEDGHVTRLGQWLRDSAPSGRRTVPSKLAALAAGVDAATVRKWASRGKLTRYGSPGRAEYDLGELRALAGRRD